MNPENESPIQNEYDNFKKNFKYYKSKNPAPNFSGVLNLHHDECLNCDTCIIKSCKLSPELEIVRQNLGVQSPKEWRIHSLTNHPGLQVISNAFTDCGSMIWIKKCVKEFSDHPFKTNLSNLGLCSKEEVWWSRVKESLVRNSKQKLITQLRWSTMGYHHNWDTKVYSLDEKSPIPNDLQNLCKLFLGGVGLNHSEFKAEAAIVNYYPLGTTLSPHTDHSEPCKEAPLLSFSFGRSGIFLIGGKDRNTTPTPLYLHHGDVMIMSGDSRLSYHAVPRIISDEDLLSCLSAKNEQVDFIDKWLEIHSSNEYTRLSKSIGKDNYVNSSQLNVETSGNNEISVSTEDININGDIEAVNRFHLNEEHSLTNDELFAIINYIKTVRININVRQVNE